MEGKTIDIEPGLMLRQSHRKFVDDIDAPDRTYIIVNRPYSDGSDGKWVCNEIAFRTASLPRMNSNVVLTETDILGGKFSMSKTERIDRQTMLDALNEANGDWARYINRM